MDRARKEMSNLLDIMGQDQHELTVQHAKMLLLNSQQNVQSNLRARTPRRANIDRGRAAGHANLWNDYFADNPKYDAKFFRRRFRMQRSLFLKIEAAVVAHDRYFVQKRDAIGVSGLSSTQKICAAIRMLAYGAAADSLDEYFRISETTTIECLQRFCGAIISVFRTEYLRQPTAEDMERILLHSAKQGFPGMIGSIDCMHWDWKNCPRGWSGQFAGRSGTPSIILEAVCSYDLWIWHSFFGMPGSNNDVNVLEKSPIFQNQIEGVAPSATFIVNNKQYSQTYMLADGIYPKWSTFVHTISDPQGEKRKYFAMMQEAARKDIERAFGVLQAKWAIVREPARMWFENALQDIITTCIILHNMIVEDERDDLTLDELDYVDSSNLSVSRGRPVRDMRLTSRIQNMRALRDSERYMELQNDLIEHLWTRKGNQ